MKKELQSQKLDQTCFSALNPRNTEMTEWEAWESRDGRCDGASPKEEECKQIFICMLHSETAKH